LPIVDARALSYQQMVAFIKKQPVQIQSDEAIVPHDTVKIISITDPDVPKLFFEEVGKVITFNYRDIEATCEPEKYTPSPEHMTQEDAGKIVDFIQEVHALPARVLLLVNCMFGQARSGAIVDYTGNVCGLGYWNTRKRNPQIVPNHWNQFLLFQEFFKRKMK